MNKAFKNCKLTNKQVTTWMRFYKRQAMLNASLEFMNGEIT